MRIRMLSPLFLLIGSACMSPDSAAVEQNKALVRQMIEAVNARDLDGLDALVAANVVRHSNATPGVQIHSLTDFKAFLEQDLASFPDSRQEILSIIGEGDYVAVRVSYSGTQQGPFGVFPATGRRVDIEFIGMVRIEEGKIAELWAEWDNLNMLNQLGLFPPPNP